MTVECHDTFSDPGATASDLCAGDLTGQIQVSGSVDPNTPGSYTLTYSVNDGNGNSNSVQRTVNVIDTTAPSVLLNGSASMTVECHDTFSDPGATASDLCAGDLTGQIQVSGSVDPNTPSSYTLTYSVNDGNGNSNSVQRTVNVVDTTAPSVLLNGSASMTVECHDSFSDPGATASDLCAGDLTGQIQVSGSVDPNTPGSYTLTYSVNDGNGNSNSVQRTVNVVDTTPPSVLLNGSASMTVECHDSFSDPGATASDLCAGDLTGQIQVSGSVDPNTPSSYTLTYSVNDGNGNSNSVQRTVNVVDTTVPVLTAPGAVNRTTSADATSCGVVIPDADLGTASATDVCAGVLLVDRSGVPSGNLFPVGTTVLTYSAMDPSGNPIAATQNITVTDGTPPTMTPIADIVRLPDAGTCSATVTFAAGANDNCSGVAVVASPPSGSSFPLGTTLVTCTATDGVGNQTTATFSVTILNPAPVATITGPASGSIFPIDVPVSLSGMFTDNAGDIHTAAWSLDGITTPGTVDEALKTVSGSYTFTAPGIYFVSLTVTDQCGGSSTATRVGAFDAMVVIYDPNAGFVTGGGWINSPAGALAANPSLAGRANFGFVSKYKKGASVPTGETEFQFRLGNLNFHSTEYNWLVVSGAKAQFKGSGTINGASDYGFLLSAVDGQLSGGGGMDKFRMKIVDKLTGAVIYDNQMGAPDSSSATTFVAGGSIVIHNSAKGNTSTSGEMVEMGLQSPSGFLLAQNSPNPFRGATQVHFALSQSSRVRLTVYDVSGREIMTLAEGEWAAGNHTVIWSGRTRDGNAARAGVYFARLAAEPQDGKPFTAMRKMLLIN